jgi:hypothetical protein
MGCSGSQTSLKDLPPSMRFKQMHDAMPTLERFSLPFTGGKVTVNGKLSPGSRWCTLPDGKYFIYLDQADLTPESPEGVFLMDWAKKSVSICIRSDFLVKDERLIFLTYPINAFEALTIAGLGEYKPISFYKKDSKDLFGLGVKLGSLDIFIESPSAQRDPVWDELDTFHGDHADPRNIDAYPKEWHEWAARRFNQSGESPPPPPRTTKKIN